METANSTSFASSSSSPIAVTELFRPKEEIADSSGDMSSSSSKDPLPYDPLLGWYTAATLSGLLILFLVCVGLEKIKDRILMSFDHQAVAQSLRGGAGEPCLGPGASDSAGALGPGGDDDGGDAKGASRVDAPGRNCCGGVEHNYVYLTLDRTTNHADAVSTAAAPQPRHGGDPGGDPMGWGEGRGPGQQQQHVEARTTEGETTSLGVTETHSVKIEIVEVHSETQVVKDDEMEMRRKDSVVSGSAAAK